MKSQKISFDEACRALDEALAIADLLDAAASHDVEELRPGTVLIASHLLKDRLDGVRAHCFTEAGRRIGLEAVPTAR